MLKAASNNRMPEADSLTEKYQLLKTLLKMIHSHCDTEGNEHIENGEKKLET